MEFQSIALPTELRYRPSQKRNESDSEIKYLILIITPSDKNRLLWYIHVVLSIVHGRTHHPTFGDSEPQSSSVSSFHPKWDSIEINVCRQSNFIPTDTI